MKNSKLIFISILLIFPMSSLYSMIPYYKHNLRQHEPKKIALKSRFKLENGHKNNNQVVQNMKSGKDINENQIPVSISPMSLFQYFKYPQKQNYSKEQAKQKINIIKSLVGNGMPLKCGEEVKVGSITSRILNNKNFLYSSAAFTTSFALYYYLSSKENRVLIKNKLNKITNIVKSKFKSLYSN